MSKTKKTTPHHSGIVFPIATLVVLASVIIATNASVSKVQFMVFAAVWVVFLLGLKWHQGTLHMHSVLDSLALLAIVEIAAALAL